MTLTSHTSHSTKLLTLSVLLRGLRLWRVAYVCAAFALTIILCWFTDPGLKGHYRFSEGQEQHADACRYHDNNYVHDPTRELTEDRDVANDNEGQGHPAGVRGYHNNKMLTTRYES